MHLMPLIDGDITGRARGAGSVRVLFTHNVYGALQPSPCLARVHRMELGVFAVQCV